MQYVIFYIAIVLHSTKKIVSLLLFFYVPSVPEKTLLNINF